MSHSHVAGTRHIPNNNTHPLQFEQSSISRYKTQPPARLQAHSDTHHINLLEMPQHNNTKTTKRNNVWPQIFYSTTRIEMTTRFLDIDRWPGIPNGNDWWHFSFESVVVRFWRMPLFVWRLNVVLWKEIVQFGDFRFPLPVSFDNVFYIA